MTNENLLVSITVITYNSSKFVLETLESAKQQTYQNIELIISDDCSTDNTVDICKDWLEKNKGRFIRSEIITIDHNTGIPANCNRAIKACKGEWIKGIAGDDILLPNCVVDCINYILDKPYIEFLFSKIDVIAKNEKLGEEFLSKVMNYSIFNLSSNEQYKHLLHYGNCIPAATLFVRTKVIKALGGYDERIPLLEDYPMWLKVTKKNIKLYLLDKVTVMYRVSEQSISFSYNTKKCRQSLALCYTLYIYKSLAYKKTLWSIKHYIECKLILSNKIYEYLFYGIIYIPFWFCTYIKKGIYFILCLKGNKL
jgi:glycosyltransferase involved in cell wall biosynthesis